MRNPTGVATALLFSCLTASAFAGERDIINQANPLDQTMRFYLHPAHLYLSGQPPHPLGEHPAVLVKRNEAKMNRTEPLSIRPHPASHGHGDQLAGAGQSQPANTYP
jgi:hypothetical protein